MKKRSEEVLETPITPMIDVVFQLIIFFVVSAAQQNDLIDLSLNLAQAKDVSAVKKNDPLAVTINVHEDGKVNIAMQEMTMPQLRHVLKSTVAQYGNRVPIILRCDKRALYREVDKVMAVIGEAGLYRVRIAAVAGGKN